MSHTDLKNANGGAGTNQTYLLLKLFETSDVDYFALVLIKRHSFFIRLSLLEAEYKQV